tara:strand:- start:172 stop:510 length:339 start_codon:yes stop_codon:yes gene_type:complete
MEKKLINISKYYFRIFANKNLDKLEKLFTKDKILIDWENKIIGRKKVLNFCKNLFEKNEIKIKVIKIYTLKNRYTTSCQIEITLNKKNYLRVVDIIYFNKNYKIKKIEAYKG